MLFDSWDCFVLLDCVRSVPCFRRPGGVLFGSKGAILGFGYVVILLLHGAAFILILMLFSRLEGYAALKAGFMAAIILSLFMIAVQKVMFDESAASSDSAWNTRARLPS